MALAPSTPAAYAPYAMDVRASRGRKYPEPAHPYRNEYARDRDRVIHSRAFRRLEAKTQVFTTRYSDHFRNRLTHTLEVAQVARTVSTVLQLNSDLAEALALVHDIGHPPFGHAGERRLDRRMREHGERFDHNLQALRTIEKFEQRYLDFPGLNLTFEVREGIIKHSRDYSADQNPELAQYLLDQRPPLEAQLIDLVDEIAYNTADLDDGFEARLVNVDALCGDVPFVNAIYKDVEKSHPKARRKLKFNETIRRIFDRLVTDLIESTRQQVQASGVKSVEGVRQQAERLVRFSPGVAAESAALKNFLTRHVYSNPAISEDRDRSVAALDALFLFFIDHPDRMPASYAQMAAAEPRHRVVCDYIAGMTDHFLLRQCREILRIPVVEME
ncbi:MAG TPA: deoxyguanosinetriphosphate triphosphohydrolase [Candidatus Acidoferrales bacterium]|nr:deoxyguanosinetriphosphate triphosphohydrolase [Candidatus Acidoferrales bacterium]